MRVAMMGAVLAIGVAGGVQAADRTATSAIFAGDYARAEEALNAERRIFPKRPELMLNLAAVYRQTGRDDAARALYADVLRHDAVDVNLTKQRTASSHAVAKAGLARLTQMAAR